MLTRVSKIAKINTYCKQISKIAKINTNCKQISKTFQKFLKRLPATQVEIQYNSKDKYVLQTNFKNSKDKYVYCK